MLKRNKLRGCSLRALRNQSKPLDNVAVTLMEQHFDRASESRAEIFPVAAYTSIGTWRTMAREAATRHSSCCDFGSRAAVRCTLICPRYLLRVMSPEDQRSVYICDNTLIGWCVDSAVPHTTCKKDKKNKDCELSSLIFAHCRVGKLTAHRLQIDTTFCEWPPRSVICWHPRTGVSLPVTPSVIDGRSPSHLFLTCHSGHLFLPRPTCASAPGAATRVLLQCHGTRVDRRIPSPHLSRLCARFCLPRVYIPRSVPAAGSSDFGS